jgi:hypothetical protein
MPSERTRIRVGDAEPLHADPERAIASDVHGDLRAALDGDLAREARFWRARAEELAAQVETVQKRLLALTDHLPTRFAHLPAYDLADLQREADWPDPLADWKETTLLEPASVASDLPRLWKRLGHVPAR